MLPRDPYVPFENTPLERGPSVSSPDDPDKKPPPQRTVAWNPDDVPGVSEQPDEPENPGASDPKRTPLP